MLTVTRCELHTLFEPGTSKFIKTPFIDAFPRDFRAALERARESERSRPAWATGITVAEMYETHAYFLAEDPTGYKIDIAVFETDPRKAVPTFEAALDMIDMLKDEMESVPELRSFVMVEVIEAVPGWTDDDESSAKWEELEAYIRAAGAGPW